MKRLIAKIQRDKTPAIKDLMLKEEQQMEANDDFRIKTANESEKHVQLLDDLINLKENLKLTKDQFAFLTKESAVVDNEVG